LADVWEQALDKDLAKIWRRLEPLQKKRRVELAAQEPLDDWYRGRENYHGYLDSPRWKRKREMKFVAVNGRCEYPGCLAFAEECHHKHYDNVGSETNGDLVALCSGHHRMVHAYY
jgi:hypothetical protein